MVTPSAHSELQHTNQEIAALVTVYANGKPERLAKIEAAKTLTDIQKVFIEIVDQSTAGHNS